MVKINLYGILAIICIITFSCGDKNNRNFWEGSVQPGTYSAMYYFNKYNKNSPEIQVTLSIEEDQSFELREKWKGGGCAEGTRVYYGTLSKYQEVYNGSLKTWYVIVGFNSRSEINAKYSLTTNMELHEYDFETYQDLSQSERCCILKKID